MERADSEEDPGAVDLANSEAAIEAVGLVAAADQVTGCVHRVVTTILPTGVNATAVRRPNQLAQVTIVVAMVAAAAVEVEDGFMEIQEEATTGPEMVSAAGVPLTETMIRAATTTIIEMVTEIEVEIIITEATAAIGIATMIGVAAMAEAEVPQGAATIVGAVIRDRGLIRANADVRKLHDLRETHYFNLKCPQSKLIIVLG